MPTVTISRSRKRDICLVSQWQGQHWTWGYSCLALQIPSVATDPRYTVVGLVLQQRCRSCCCGPRAATSAGCRRVGEPSPAPRRGSCPVLGRTAYPLWGGKGPRRSPWPGSMCLGFPKVFCSGPHEEGQGTWGEGGRLGNSGPGAGKAGRLRSTEGKSPRTCALLSSKG